MERGKRTRSSPLLVGTLGPTGTRWGGTLHSDRVCLSPTEFRVVGRVEGTNGVVGDEKGLKSGLGKKGPGTLDRRGFSTFTPDGGRPDGGGGMS